ncbi:DMT family transporter [Oscillibacter sp.]|uniref:DMT family transporter n=1 Tax=Oscillibacter sp. TaxID=1945593 RepID=UPI00262EA874|nr:DMT family transporter [Oscillibacter sp.]MDD3347181.1 DMT family transporter [Oscillibacter sp.]
MKQLIVLLGVVGGSLSSVFVRYSTAPSLILVLYRMAFSVLLLTPTAWRHRGEFAALPRRTLALCIASGVALGAHFSTFFEAVKTTSIASATVLVDMEVLFVALSTVLLFHRRLSGKAWAAILLAFAGAVAVALADTTGGGGTLWGDALAVLSAMCIGVYTLIGSVCRRTVSTPVYTYLVYGVAGATVLLLALGSGTALFGYAAVNLWTALGMAVCCTLLGHSIFSWGLKFLPPSFISTMRLLDCVFASLWGLLLFGERPGTMVLLGGAVVILGVVLYSRTAADET